MKTVYLLHFLLFQMSKTNLKMSRNCNFYIQISKYFTAEKSLILQIRVDGTLHAMNILLCLFTNVATTLMVRCNCILQYNLDFYQRFCFIKIN